MESHPHLVGYCRPQQKLIVSEVTDTGRNAGELPSSFSLQPRVQKSNYNTGTQTQSSLAFEIRTCEIL